MQKLAVANPALGPIWREYDANYDPKPVQDMAEEQVSALLQAIRETDWSMGYDADAKASYATFVKLRDDGKIDQGEKFQVCLPGVSSFAIFIKPAFQYLVEDLVYEVMRKEVRAIVEGIPAEELAVQSDIASDYIKCEVQRHPEYLEALREDFLPPQEDAMERYSKQHAGLLDLLPPGAEAGLHICMGNINNKPILAPQTMDVMVNLVNSIAAKTSRKLQWVHFGVLPEWQDSKMYEPLQRLAIKDAAVYLGLVYPDDAEGAKKRKQSAEKVLSDFGISPPCGLARTSEEGVESVFGILTALSAAS